MTMVRRCIDFIGYPQSSLSSFSHDRKDFPTNETQRAVVLDSEMCTKKRTKETRRPRKGTKSANQRDTSVTYVSGLAARVLRTPVRGFGGSSVASASSFAKATEDKTARHESGNGGCGGGYESTSNCADGKYSARLGPLGQPSAFNTQHPTLNGRSGRARGVNHQVTKTRRAGRTAIYRLAIYQGWLVGLITKNEGSLKLRLCK
jgi:hypothetical protein